MSQNGPDPSDVSSAAAAPEKTERTLGSLCHLLALCGFLGIPFANIFAPLVLWVIKKDDSPFVDDQGKESVNFQITMTLAAIVSGVLVLLLVGILLLIVLLVLDVVFIIIATIKASNGERYRYPFCLRLIK